MNGASASTGAQCRHQTPCGLSNSGTRIILQHIEQSPQLRPGTIFGVWFSPVIREIERPIGCREALGTGPERRNMAPRSRRPVRVQLISIAE